MKKVVAEFSPEEKVNRDSNLHFWGNLGVVQIWTNIVFMTLF